MSLMTDRNHIPYMLPTEFATRLSRIIPPSAVSAVLSSFEQPKPLTLRVVRPAQIDQGAWASSGFQSVSWYPSAWIAPCTRAMDLPCQPALDNGDVYIQALSSMVPVIVLDPQPGETILDLCAAPGSKTSQMVMHMQDRGVVIANEPIRSRYFRLRSVLDKLGCQCVKPVSVDGRRFQSQGLIFDRVLVDAPCSSEGRFKTYDKDSIGYWSLRKIREMRKKQRGLLWNACRLVKPGGVVVYATCTFAPEENEGVVDWVLRKTGGDMSVEKAEVKGIVSYPALREWEGKVYDPQVSACLRILPTEHMDGFFVTRLRRSMG